MGDRLKFRELKADRKNMLKTVQKGREEWLRGKDRTDRTAVEVQQLLSSNLSLEHQCSSECHSRNCPVLLKIAVEEDLKNYHELDERLAQIESQLKKKFVSFLPAGLSVKKLKVMSNDPPIEETTSSGSYTDSSVLPACAHRRDETLPVTFFAQTTTKRGVEPDGIQHFFGLHQFTPNGHQTKFLVQLTTERPYFGCKHYILEPRLTAIDEIERKLYILEPLFVLKSTTDSWTCAEIHGYRLREFALHFNDQGIVTDAVEGRSSYTVNVPMARMANYGYRPVRLVITPNEGKLRVLLTRCRYNSGDVNKCQLLFARLIFRDNCNASHKTFFWKTVTVIHDKFMLNRHCPIILLLKPPAENGKIASTCLILQCEQIKGQQIDHPLGQEASTILTTVICDGENEGRRNNECQEIITADALEQRSTHPKWFLLGRYNKKLLIRLGDVAFPLTGDCVERSCAKLNLFSFDSPDDQTLAKMSVWGEKLESNQWLEFHQNRIWRCTREDATSPRVKIDTYSVQPHLSSRAQCIVCRRYADRYDTLMRCRKCKRIFGLKVLQLRAPKEHFCSRRCLKEAWLSHETCLDVKKLGAKKRAKIIEKARRKSSQLTTGECCVLNVSVDSCGNISVTERVVDV